MIPMTLPRGMGKGATVWATGAAEFVTPLSPLPPPPPPAVWVEALRSCVTCDASAHVGSPRQVA